MRLLLIISATLFVLASCGKEPDFGSCHIPEDLTQECNQLQVDKECQDLMVKCKASCMVQKHPECSDNLCLIYNYTDMVSGAEATTPPFCTWECTPKDAEGNSDDCGSGALCKPYLGSNYCIPLKYINKP